MLASLFSLRRLLTKADNRRDRRRNKGRTYRPILMMLEDRICPSVFYDFDVIAQTGDITSTGNIISGFPSGPSVNDYGEVAVTANVDTPGGPVSASVLLFSAGSGPTQIISEPPTIFRDYLFPQITDDHQVVVRDLAGGVGGGGPYRIRTWDSANPGSNNIIVEGGKPSPEITFASVTVPSRAEDGGVAFIGTESATGTTGLYFNNGPKPGADDILLTTLTGGYRPMAANGGRVVIRTGGTQTDPIMLYQLGGAPVTIASSAMGFTALGRRPGISDDGKIVVFAGDRNGPGVFASVDDGTGFGPAFRIVGENSGAAHSELGYDDAGKPLFFSSFDIDTRVGVTKLDLGAPGLQDDSFVVTFIATPNAASRTDPATGAKPLLFSAQKGIWSVRVDVKQELQAPMGMVFHPTGAIPVIQLGDMLNGGTVNNLDLWDPLGNATRDQAGNARIPRRGDHYLAFWADTSAGEMIVRGAHLDSDEDGLLDHWETKGIDIDQDGTVDLDLAAMGANPYKRDLFMEMDWTKPRTSGVPTNWSNEPAAGATKFLADMFAAAPALADGVAAGITLHIDAGSGNDTAGDAFSQNMGNIVPKQGGDLIGQSGSPNTHLDVVYFGLPGSLTLPGVQTRDFQGIKDAFFGTADKRARELAFHYVVLADFQDLIPDAAGNVFSANVTAATNTTLTSATALPADPAGSADLGGNAVIITSGRGKGQVRMLDPPSTVGGNLLTVTQPWATNPNNSSTFALLDGSSGLGEAFFYPDPDANSIPGNDNLITMGGFGVNAAGTLASTYDQERTLAHELGHTLGLRHGGTDHNSMKGNAYLSLMSYSWQTANPVAPPGTNVNSYSSAGDPTYNDWANLQLDFQNSAIHLGNTFNLGLKGIATQKEEPALNVFQYVTLRGSPIDLQPPSVTIDSPGAGAAVAIGSNLTVNLTVFDAVGVDSVLVTFDVNGDGTIDPSETVAAGLVSPNKYSATFTNIQGSSGVRDIRAKATDTSQNPGIASISVNVGSSVSSAPTVISPTVTGITLSAATLGGNVSGDGGAAISKRGVVFALTANNPNPTIGGSGVTEVDDASASTGVFTLNASGLSAGAGYSFAAFASNSVGTTYTSPVTTFNTLAVATAPTVSSPTVTGITSSAATLGGNVTSDGGAAISKRGVVFALTATNPNPTIGGSGVTEVDDASASTGLFTVNASGLSAGAGYSFAAFASNSVGTTYTSPVTTFNTLAVATAPTADAGGPYTVPFDGSIPLDASQSSDPDQPANTLTYLWDLDGDGIFGETGAQATRGDEVGINPTFLSAGLTPGSFFDVFVKVTDNGGLQGTAQATIHVQAPVFQFPLPAIPEDTRNPAGVRISALLNLHFFDANVNAKPGIAVVQTEGNGNWQYSVNGVKFINIGSVSHSQARLLPSAYKIRFVPAKNWNGEARLFFHGWDGSFGKAGGAVAINATGGGTPFSVGVGLASVQVNAVNDRPVLDIGGTPTLTPIAPGATNANGNTVASLLGSAMTDVDAAALQGIAIVGQTAAGGRWEFLLAGGIWTSVGTVSTNAALLLRPDDKVRFVSLTAHPGTVSLSYRAWDQTGLTFGAEGSKRSISGNTAFSTASESATLAVTSTPALGNQAPVLDTNPSPTLGTIQEDSGSASAKVAVLLGSAVSDADPQALRGIAVTGLTGASNGTWRYSLNNGRTFVSVGDVSPARALLLRDSDRLRFVPNANFNGTVNVSYRAWDRSRGAAGARANLALPATTGGSSPYSLAEETANLTVIAVNDRPVLNTAPTPLFTTIAPNTMNSNGDTVASLLGSAVTDVDAAALQGIAIFRQTATGGRWEFQLAGGIWTSVGTVSTNAALLLRPEDKLRFVSLTTTPGAVSLSYRAWDQTGDSAGSAGSKLAISNRTAFSTATETAKLTINSANSRPILNTSGSPSLTPVLPASLPAGDTVASLLGASVTDADASALRGLAIVGLTGTATGTWQYSINDGANWIDVAPVSLTSALLLRDSDRIRYVPNPGFVGKATFTFKAWDQTSGIFNTKVKTTIDTAFSLAIETATVLVNTAPELIP